MALPWPNTAPTLPRPVPTAPRPAPAGVVGRVSSAARRSPRLARLGAFATNPLTALVVMLLGLALLFVVPLVGLPFVAVVVLPAVIYHLRPEHRTALRRPLG
ncbi:hypothetical protein EV188_105176 [Actinomycetospora succinea]|uniref:Uncharacterized protein n=1 Tax=Actinomycetospora succinea TaxID=663603 RepID=A0A4V3D9J3_9PSEU|nr:hypothetical protein [Actinomycetospora succinea]TDQ55780.1 hypothetical protein EV188_105176 [Actinomycetospora succinea]